ncbi:MAG TPA: hypothetical protein VF590_16180, partial [Isosphaeraceae bacterium]
MARRKGTRAASEPGPEPEVEHPTLPPAESIGDQAGIESTGRFIIIFKDDAAADAGVIRETLNQAAGLRDVTSSADYEGGAVAAADLAEGGVIHFDRLGIVVVSGEESAQALAASASDVDSPILAIEPEYIAYPSNANVPDGGLFLEYLRGYRDAVNQLYDQLAGRGAAPGEGAEPAAVFGDSNQLTWGLQATRVSTSRRSGQGIKVAVLDTGLDLQHPDFR